MLFIYIHGFNSSPQSYKAQYLKAIRPQDEFLAPQLIVEQGGDHSFQNFQLHCDAIYQFLKGE